MTRAFYLPGDATFEATAFTRGPWSADAQHGGPPAALIARALERAGEHADRMVVARLTLELLRPVPISAMTVRVEAVKLGRTVERWAAVLEAEGKPRIRASCIRIRVGDAAASPPQGDSEWPEPESCSPLDLDFFPWDMGYHRAVDLRLVHGRWGRTPIGIWGRPKVALLDGEELSPLQALVILADAQSGMGVPLDPRRHTFVNPDLTVYLERPPTGAWFGFEIRSTSSGTGMGLAQSAIRDRRGVMARAAQSLVVAERG